MTAPLKIMVVDDERDIEPLFNQKFRRELREGRVAFHFCFSGESALEVLGGTEAADVVLILSDINMPGMTGLELLRRLKERYAHLRVFMITAYDDEEKRLAAVKYRADEYLTKPLDFESLKERILRLAS